MQWFLCFDASLVARDNSHAYIVWLDKDTYDESILTQVIIGRFAPTPILCRGTPSERQLQQWPPDYKLADGHKIQGTTESCAWMALFG